MQYTAVTQREWQAETGGRPRPIEQQQQHLAAYF